MGIIGVVAALTIPNLNSSTADKEKVAKLQKLYSNLNDAVGRATAIYGPVDEWIAKASTQDERRKMYYERITEFMKISKTCAPNTSGCFNSNFAVAKSYYQVITADGTSVVFSVWDSCANGTSSLGINDACAIIFVDIDGLKGANKLGKDIFRLTGTKTGVDYDIAIDYVAGGDSTLQQCLNFGYGCSTWVLVNGNMDYLKADTSGKCPNGKILNWTTNTSCK